MRIISGIAGRRLIKVPKGSARPTTDRAREAIFSALGDVVQNAQCLDLFAGSGALGLEALSRGAQSCIFVDREKASVATIRANLANLALSGGEVVQAETIKFCAKNGLRFNLIFADPPYFKPPQDTDFIAQLLSVSLSQVCQPNAYFVAEAPAGQVLPGTCDWQLMVQKNYGSCGIGIYRKR